MKSHQVVTLLKEIRETLLALTEIYLSCFLNMHIYSKYYSHLLTNSKCTHFVLFSYIGTEYVNTITTKEQQKMGFNAFHRQKNTHTHIYATPTLT